MGKLLEGDTSEIFYPSLANEYSAKPGIENLATGIYQELMGPAQLLDKGRESYVMVESGVQDSDSRHAQLKYHVTSCREPGVQDSDSQKCQLEDLWILFYTFSG